MSGTVHKKNKIEILMFLSKEEAKNGRKFDIKKLGSVRCVNCFIKK